MDIALKLKEELKIEKWQVVETIKLIDEGNTIPFISRYRKEVTGSLNDEILRNALAEGRLGRPSPHQCGWRFRYTQVVRGT